MAKDYPLDGNPDDALLYVGSFYVTADHRLKGIGKQLGAMALAYGKGANIVMNGSRQPPKGVTIIISSSGTGGTVQTGRIHPLPGVYERLRYCGD